MSSFLNITVSAFSKIEFSHRQIDEGNEVTSYVQDMLKRHSLSDQATFLKLNGEASESFKELIMSMYNSKCEYFAFELTGSHTLVICLNEIESDKLDHGLPKIWEDLAENFKNVSFGESISHWTFTFSIFHDKTTQQQSTDDLFAKFALSTNDFNGPGAINNSFRGWCSWNGGFIVMDPKTSTNTILYSLIIQFAKWEITETSYSTSMKLISKLLNEKGKAVIVHEEKLLHLFSKYVYYNTAMDKSLVAYDQEDILLHELIENGWGFEKLKKNTSDLFQDINRMVSFSNGIEMKKTSNKTNVFLAYIGLIGFGGTVAAIISTTDFSNSLLSSPFLRFGIIFVLTFLPLYLFNKVKRKA